MQSAPLLPEHGSCSGGSEVLDTAPPRAATRLPSSRYKGVVPQPNGRWGAQIYERHQRVWLGTFDEESAAAAAYDVAAQRFRGREASTNFGPLPPGADELDFISSRSKAEVVDMLRKHTYADELRQHGRRRGRSGSGAAAWPWPPPAAAEMELLFEKVVTPSDVGKLNRLVIPKQHAEKHFPLEVGAIAGGGGVVLLSFEDRQSGKVWRFRYSYWNSSQSYVLTKGWSRFVREKGLVPGDVISFLKSSPRSSSSSTADHHQLLYIDWKPCRVGANGLQLQEIPCLEQAVPRRQAVRLFGVNILREPPQVDGGAGGVVL